MKLMVIDRDRDTVELVESFCRDAGGEIELVIEPVKNNAVDTLRQEAYDAVLMDPAPQSEVRAFVIGIRRGSAHYTPLILASHQMGEEQAMKEGANVYLQKPYTAEDLAKVLKGIRQLGKLIRRLNSEEDEYRSRDGLISKSAFNQIFISCLDRADRYGEQTFLTFARVKNIDEIRTQHGDEIANEICENLKKYTMRIRRLSDIAGRTAAHEICLMLTRPASPDEPVKAINRFVDSMGEYAELVSAGDVQAIVEVEMMAIPSGEITFSKIFE